MKVGVTPICAGDLLHRALVEHRLVGGAQRVGVADVDLVHARAVLAVIRLDLDAVSVEHLAYAPDDGFVDRCVVNAVAVEPGVEGAKIGVVLSAQALLILAEEAHLQFRRHLGDETEVCGLLDDALEDGTGDSRRGSPCSV